MPVGGGRIAGEGCFAPFCVNVSKYRLAFIQEDTMRQLAIATAFGLAGVVVAVLVVGYVAKGNDSISDRWLVAGTVLGHRLSKGRDPWPITELRKRIPYIVVGAIIGALTWYACYVQLAAVWNQADYWTLFLDPQSIPTLGKTGGSGHSTAAPILMYILIGVVAGGWITNWAIKTKWTE
jgi:glycerol uptake facilitator-like aquaporin